MVSSFLRKRKSISTGGLCPLCTKQIISSLKPIAVRTTSLFPHAYS
ncbi:hypothetical protein LLB_1613 [Legionella longbeachae D-4968]|nr:hypothetical protein LLB_1613 [Legionella longbeachae D-4968]